MKIAIRHSIIAVALLGAIICGLSIFAVVRLMASSEAQRLERTKELVSEQVEVLQNMESPSSWLAAHGRSLDARFGVHRGVAAAGGALENVDLDNATRTLVEQVLRASEAASSGAVLQGTSDTGTTIVAGAGQSTSGKIGWVVYPVQPPPWIQTWRFLVVMFGLAGLALVTVSWHLATSVQRGASLLHTSLQWLGKDLRAPVQRPSLRELSEVADGIATLAAQLFDAQKEQQRLAQELRERERLASLGRVAAGVAHEVRNPLASIKLRLDLAASDPSAPIGLGQELAEVSAEIARLDRFVADLLIIAGRRTGPQKPSDLTDLAQHRIALIQPWAKERRVEIAVLGKALALIDSDAVARVIDNLVRNAVEASSPEGLVQVVLTQDKEQATLQVLDPGPGVEPSRESELFEPFFTTKSEGMGLGLALSRAIASAHGGSLTYDRKDNQTRFTLRLRAPTASISQETNQS